MTNKERIRELLKNAEKFDGLSFIKERIANREQLRKEKREKLKELMTNETKQTAVDIIYQGMSDKIVMQDLNKALICIHISHDDFLKLHKQAQEMEKERIETAYNKGTVHGIDYPESTLPLTGEQYYNETYGGNK